jgi:DNA-binding transcriptional ArsR family regulator
VPTGNTLSVIRKARQDVLLLHPTRQKIVENLKEPGSASSLARRLGLPRQRLNYHLRKLEKQGFVELVEERRTGNCVERVVRATARSYLISPEALGLLGSSAEERQDHWSASYLIAAAARVVRDVASLQARAEAAQKRLATFTLETDVRLASAAERNAFAEELATAVGRLTAKYHDEHTAGGRDFRLILGGYPAVAAGEEQEQEP